MNMAPSTLYIHLGEGSGKGQTARLLDCKKVELTDDLPHEDACIQTDRWCCEAAMMRAIREISEDYYHVLHY